MLLLQAMSWFVFNLQSIALPPWSPYRPVLFCTHSLCTFTVHPSSFHGISCQSEHSLQMSKLQYPYLQPNGTVEAGGDNSSPLAPRHGTERVAHGLLTDLFDYWRADVLLLPLPSPGVLPKYYCLFFRSTRGRKHLVHKGPACAPIAFPHPAQ